MPFFELGTIIDAPLHLLTNKAPDLTHLQPFGRLMYCHVYVEKRKGKDKMLTERATIAAYAGYEPKYHSYVVYDQVDDAAYYTGAVRFSMDLDYFSHSLSDHVKDFLPVMDIPEVVQHLSFSEVINFEPVRILDIGQDFHEDDQQMYGYVQVQLIDGNIYNMHLPKYFENAKSCTIAYDLLDKFSQSYFITRANNFFPIFTKTLYLPKPHRRAKEKSYDAFLTSTDLNDAKAPYGLATFERAEDGTLTFDQHDTDKSEIAIFRSTTRSTLMKIKHSSNQNNTDITPISAAQADNLPDAPLWREAREEELTGMCDVKKTFGPLPVEEAQALDPYFKFMKLIWVFKRKMANGICQTQSKTCNPMLCRDFWKALQQDSCPCDKTGNLECNRNFSKSI